MVWRLIGYVVEFVFLVSLTVLCTSAIIFAVRPDLLVAAFFVVTALLEQVPL